MKTLYYYDYIHNEKPRQFWDNQLKILISDKDNLLEFDPLWEVKTQVVGEAILYSVTCCKCNSTYSWLSNHTYELPPIECKHGRFPLKKAREEIDG